MLEAFYKQHKSRQTYEMVNETIRVFLEAGHEDAELEVGVDPAADGKVVRGSHHLDPMGKGAL